MADPAPATQANGRPSVVASDRLESLQPFDPSRASGSSRAASRDDQVQGRSQLAEGPGTEAPTNSARVAGRTPRRQLEIWLPLLVLLVDQLTKTLIQQMVPLHTSVSVVPGLLDLTHVRNTGAAFGILNTVDFPFKAVVIPLIASAALVAVGLYSASLARHQLAARVGLALVIGGAAGNLIDRVMAGHVVDFVDVYWRTHHFWAFNAADSAITVGVAIMILDMIGRGAHASTPV